MKSRLALLTKKELLLNFGMRNPKKEPNPVRFLLIRLIVLAMLPMFFLLYTVLKELHSVLYVLNQIPAYFMLVFLMAQLFLLFTGIPVFMGRFYGNRDNPILLAMPIRPGDILLSRFIPVLLTQILTALVLLLPAIIIHAMRVPTGGSDWLLLLSGVVGSLIFPTVLSAVIVLLVMRYTNVGKYSDKLKTFGTLLILLLIVGFQAMAQNFAGGSVDENFLLRILTDNRVLIENIATLFLPARWTGFGIVATGAEKWLYIGLNLLVSVLAAGVLQWMGANVYLKSLLSGTEMAKEKKKTEEKIRISGMHPVFRVLLTEWRLLTRTPAFAINVLSTPLMVSIIWLIPILTNDTLSKQIGNLRTVLQSAAVPGWLYFMAAGIFGAAVGIFMSLFSETATSFSREGQAFWLRRVLPIRASYEIIGRSLLNLLLTMGTTAIFLVAGYVFLRYPLWLIPVALLFSGLFSLPLCFIGLLIDVHRPKMNWDDPNQAVKQNLNSLLSFVAGIAYLLILFGAGYLLYKNISDPERLIQTGFLVLTIINIVLAVLSYVYLLRSMPGAIARME